MPVCEVAASDEPAPAKARAMKGYSAGSTQGRNDALGGLLHLLGAMPGQAAGGLEVAILKRVEHSRIGTAEGARQFGLRKAHGRGAQALGTKPVCGRAQRDATRFLGLDGAREMF